MRVSKEIAKPVFELVAELNDMVETGSKLIPREKPPKFDASIEFSNVTFAYPDDGKEIFTNLSFHIKAGDFIGIKGPSGSGKSTLVDIMLGLIQPASGSVLISNLTPNEAVKVWPGKIGYAPQTFSLFPGSIMTNISVGQEPTYIDEARCWEVLSQVGLYDFVKSLKDGLNSKIVDRGINLSGGQKQRLMLARCLFSDPEIIILDEITSSLDLESANILKETISKFRGEKTIVLITHQEFMVEEANQVIFVGPSF